MKPHNDLLACWKTAKRSEKFDCYYCEQCQKWLESNCKDPNCEFCKDRPEVPPKDLSEKE
jgi:hypothetical protein